MTFWIIKDAKFLYEDNEDWSEYAEAQVDLSLRLAYMSEGTFSHVTAHTPIARPYKPIAMSVTYFHQGGSEY